MHLSDSEFELLTNPWFSGALTVACVIYYRYRMQSADAASAWPTVEGVVLSHDVVGSNVFYRAMTRNYGTITYQYVVDGRSYESSQVRDGTNPHRAGALSSSILRSLQAGRKVKVHYDPMDPGRAVLYPGHGTIRAQYLCVFACCVFMFALGLLMRFAKMVG